MLARSNGNPQVIEMLEYWVEEAKKGEIHHAAIVGSGAVDRNVRQPVAAVLDHHRAPQLGPHLARPPQQRTWTRSMRR